jgi:hypothetical protein
MEGCAMTRHEALAAPHPFSVKPGVDYWLAIGIPLALFWLFQIWQITHCARLEDPWGSDVCRHDYVQNQETAGHHFQFLFWSTFVIPTPLVLIPLLAVINAPLFLGALFLEKRLCLTKSVTGTAYWMAAWILIGISPLAAFMVINDGLVSTAIPMTATERAVLLLFVLHGTVMGIIYCVSSFLRRGITAV